MSSLITWLAFSEKERQRALEVVGAFGEHETRDELGLGSVRNAYADILFPGTGTVQTRAKYFLFVPWIYRALEQKQVSSARFAIRARQQEVALIEGLKRSGERDGLIGVEAGANLRRLPSEIYWSGLGSLGIRLFPGSRGQYFRYVDRFYERRWRGREDGDDEESGSAARPNWHSGLPEPDVGFPDKAKFALARDQASYLREQIMLHAPGTMLAFLVDRGKPVDRVRLPWEHPQYAEMDGAIQHELAHARRFSDSMYGASMLYNLMLAEKRSRADLKEYYRGELQSWCAEVGKRRRELGTWDLDEFWATAVKRGGRIPRLTRSFAEGWIAAFVHGAAGKDWEQHARRMVRDRERQVKGPGARIDDPRKLEEWSGASAAFRISYRWPQAMRIVDDILGGLGK